MNDLQAHVPDVSASVIRWLLDADPAIRWQVMQDIIDAPAAEVAAERARVASEGWGAALLAMQGDDGSWGGVAWNRGFDSTMHVLMLLRDMGLDPDSDAAQQAMARVRAGVTWSGWDTYEGNPFFAGETEPCINGQMSAAGAYFKQDVGSVIDRLLGEQLTDGGWNCEAENGALKSSFHTTICVLEALLAYEQTFGARPDVTAARLRGEAYFLERRLFRTRSGLVIELDAKLGGVDSGGQPAFTRFAYPMWWHFDVLRGLDYLRSAGVRPDARLAEAIALVESKRGADGRWQLDVQYPGTMLVEVNEGVGQPSRWNTLRALRVLKWYAAG